MATRRRSEDLDQTKAGHSIGFTGGLWEALEAIGTEIGYTKDKRGPHSRLVRSMLSACVNRWQKSPYISTSERCVILVNESGDIFCIQRQVLRMNFDRERIPFGISMKPEKRNVFLVTAPAGIDQAAWLRDHWLINCFRLWKNARAEGEPFSTFTDELGIESKCADLPASAQEGDLVTREALFGLRDYVQWQTGEQGWDRVGIPIDVPALDFKADVLLDQALFRGSVGLENSKQIVTLEMRNREGARFQPETVTKDPENPIHSQVLPMPREELIDLWEGTRNRIVSAAMVPEQQANNSLASRLATPAKFLHFRLEWPSPYFGLEVCFRWRKPVRPTELQSPKEPEKPKQ